jgi:hypothetical protein
MIMGRHPYDQGTGIEAVINCIEVTIFLFFFLFSNFLRKIWKNKENWKNKTPTHVTKAAASRRVLLYSVCCEFPNTLPLYSHTL